MTNDNVSVREFRKLQKFISNAASHNSLLQRNDITEYFEDGTLYKRVNGTDGFEPYEGIYPGCYFDCKKTITAPGSSTTGTSIILVDGLHMLNPYQFGGTDTPHIICSPLTHFGMAQMNTTNITTGGYVGSNMFKSILGAVVSSGAASGTINQQLYYVFGSHLKTTNELLTNTVNTAAYNKLGTNSGASSNWAWTNVQSVLFSEMEVYGGTVWSSSGYDTGNAKHQMPAFEMDESLMMPYPIYFWLKDVVTSSFFANAGGYFGFADYASASNSNCVRPRFVIS